MRYLLLLLLPLASCYFAKNFSKDNTLSRPAASTDLLAHRKNSLEWWYFANHIKDERGVEYGLMFTVFKRYTLFTGHVWMLNGVVSNKKTGEVKKWVSFLKVPPRYQRNAPLKLKGENREAEFSITQVNGAEMQLEFRPKIHKNKFPSFTLKTKPSKELVWHGKDGYLNYGEGVEAGYISYSNLEVMGQLRTLKDTLDFAGQGWFDKQWNCIDIAKPHMSWKWLCVQFENKSELMIFYLVNKKTKASSLQGTIVDSIGNATHFDLPKEAWQERSQMRAASGKIYPVLLKIEMLNGVLEVECPAVSHEVTIKAPFKTIITYSEMPANASFTINNQNIAGKAFVECTNTDR